MTTNQPTYPPSKSGLFQLIEIQQTPDGNYKFVVENANDSKKKTFPVFYDDGKFNLRNSDRQHYSKDTKNELEEYLSEQLKKHRQS